MRADWWRSLPAFWRLQWRMLGPQHALFWAPVAGAGALALLSGALLYGSEQTLFRTVEVLAPLLAALVTAFGLRLESAPGTPVRLTRMPVEVVVRLKVLTALAVALAAALPPLLVAFVYNPTLPLLDMLYSGAVSSFYLACVAAAATLLSGSALVGGGAAVTLLLLDHLLGYPANPLFSLQGGLAHFDRQPLHEWWLFGKVGLAVAGVAVVAYGIRRHRALALARSPETQRAAAMLAVFVGAGLISGVAGNLLQDPSLLRSRGWGTMGWLPAPVRARLARAPQYVPGQSLQELHLLRVLERWPETSGADEAAYSLLLTRLQRRPYDDDAVFAFVDRYPASPRAAEALARLLPSAGHPGESALRATEKLLDQYPDTDPARGVAARLLPMYPSLVSAELMRKAAVVAAGTRDPLDAGHWLTVAAEMSLALQQRDEARRHLQDARAALNRSGGGAGPQAARRIAALRQTVTELSRLLEEGS